MRSINWDDLRVKGWHAALIVATAYVAARPEKWGWLAPVLTASAGMSKAPTARPMASAAPLSPPPAPATFTALSSAQLSAPPKAPITPARVDPTPPPVVGSPTPGPGPFIPGTWSEPGPAS